jgi:hypothetical protein
MTSLRDIRIRISSLFHNGPTGDIIDFEIATATRDALEVDRIELRIAEGSPETRTFTFSATELLEAITRATIDPDAVIVDPPLTMPALTDKDGVT